MNDKKVIERFKTERQDAEKYAPPILMSVEDLLYWYRLLEEALANPNRNSEQPLDKPKSEARLEFDAMIFRISERWKGVPPFVLTSSAPGALALSDTQANEPPEYLLATLLRKLDRR
jgi:hypothetical protein